MPSHLAKWLKWRAPETCIVLWALFLCAAIWAHVRHAQQPPIYDAMGYYAKAYYFWQALGKGQLFNPFNLDPVVRPPGTILMSYPFGFDPDPRGFYFRSIFFPAVLMMLAVLIAGYPTSSERQDRWRAALMTIFFSTAPLFYWFSVNLKGATPSYWGLVDNFLSGVAALSAAAAWRGVNQRWLTWFCIAGFASSLCILIKPSGVAVAAVIGLMSSLLCLVAYRTTMHAPSAHRVETRRRLLIGIFLIGTIDMCVLATSLATDYLSHETMAWGRTAIAVLKLQFKTPISALLTVAHMGPGDAFMLWMMLTVLIILAGWIGAKSISKQVFALLAAAVLAAIFSMAVGIWFWLDVGGGIIIRYGMPFFMMSMVWMIPALRQCWGYAPRLLTVSMVVIMLAGSANLALLLAQSNPPVAWQERTGISLDAGRPFAGTVQLHRFVDTPRSVAMTVYSFDTNEADAILTALNSQHELFHPELPTLIFRRPLDWVRPTTFHLDELVSSDYLLFDPQLDARARERTLDIRSIGSFADEQAVFIAWATDLTPADGIDVVINSPNARVLYINDRSALRNALFRMVLQRCWRAVFTDANSEVKTDQVCCGLICRNKVQ